MAAIQSIVDTKWAVAKWHWERHKSKSNLSEKSRSAENHLVLRADARKIVEKWMHETFEKLDERMINIVAPIVFISPKACDIDHSSGFIKGAR